MKHSILFPDVVFIQPEIILAGLGVLTLLLCLSRYKKLDVIRRVVLYAQAAILGGSVILLQDTLQYGQHFIYGGLFTASMGMSILGLAFQSIGLIIAWMSKRENEKLPLEFYGVLNSGTVSLMLLAKASNFFSLFLCLEASTLFITLMLAMGAKDSHKVALKYLLQSALSAGFLVWGIVLIYAATGSFSYGSLSPRVFGDYPLLTFSGAGLIIAALAFKMGLFPFCSYLPEIYEGASWSVIGFLSTGSKLAAAISLMGLLVGPFLPIASVYQPILALVIILTLIWGALSALHETNIKRLLSLSGIVHMGFITAAVFVYTLTLSPHALQAVGFYFMVYVSAMLLILYCLVEFNPPDASLAGLQDAYSRHPAMTILLVLGFASLAGLPPLGGFLAKFFVFYNCLLLQVWGLIAVLIIASLMAIYYYLRVVYGFFGKHADAFPAQVTIIQQIPLSTRLFTGFLAAVILLLGVAQGPLSLLVK